MHFKKSSCNKHSYLKHVAGQREDRDSGDQGLYATGDMAAFAAQPASAFTYGWIARAAYCRCRSTGWVVRLNQSACGSRRRYCAAWLPSDAIESLSDGQRHSRR